MVFIRLTLKVRRFTDYYITPFEIYGVGAIPLWLPNTMGKIFRDRVVFRNVYQDFFFGT